MGVSRFISLCWQRKWLNSLVDKRVLNIPCLKCKHLLAQMLTWLQGFDVQGSYNNSFDRIAGCVAPGCLCVSAALLAKVLLDFRQRSANVKGNQESWLDSLGHWKN